MPETRLTYGGHAPPSRRNDFGIREAMMQTETHCNSFNEGRRI